MPDKPNLDGAYDLKTPDDNRRLYREWAKTYDQTFAQAHGFWLPQIVASAFEAAGGRGPVLDVGAGTGLVGQSLASLGVVPIDAFDLSGEMLDEAENKAVYRDLIQGNILERNPSIPDRKYDGIVSSGTFTMGHIGPEAFDEILRIAANGALVTVAINAQHYQNADFGLAFDQLKGQIKGLSLTETRIYAKGATGDHADDKALIAQFVVA